LAVVLRRLCLRPFVVAVVEALAFWLEVALETIEAVTPKWQKRLAGLDNYRALNSTPTAPLKAAGKP
jgi:hypothetical protein